MDDLRGAMAAILGAFWPGCNAFLTRIFQGKPVEKILFAATKADHLHHSQHGQLTAITRVILRDAKDRADFAGAETDAMSIAGGGGVLSKVSRRFGEGVINGALTARVGVAAIEVCRPLLFATVKRPSVTALVKRSLTGLFGGA